MAKDKEENQGLSFGGRSAREVWEDSYDKRPDIVRHYSDKGKLMQTDYLSDDRGGDEFYDAAFNRNLTTVAAKNWEKDKEWAQVSGNWIGNANEHASKLYNKHGMDYNDMRKYADKAGVGDINSQNDVKAIKKAYKNEHVTQKQLNKVGKKTDKKIAKMEKKYSKQSNQNNNFEFNPAAKQAKERVQNFQGGQDGSRDAYKLDFKDV